MTGPRDDNLPPLGRSRLVVLAETETIAIHRAKRAYKLWLKYMELPWVRNGMKLPRGLQLENVDGASSNA